MNNIRLIILILLITFPFVLLAQKNISKNDTLKKYTLTKIGQNVPDFSFINLKGEKQEISQFKGKVILINFFATWCPPCLAEIPHLENDIWKKYKDMDFILLSFGREHNQEELELFVKKKGLTFPVIPDIKREIFSKFASQQIPRNFVINKEGKIIYQHIGFDENSFKELVAIIEKELKK